MNAPASSTPVLVARALGEQDYGPVLESMRTYTASRSAGSDDELWLVAHRPVFTLGQAGRHEHVLAPGDIPVVESDRGGQVTYHGPGQAVLYTMIDLRRAHLGVRRLVEMLEQSVIDVLAGAGVTACRRERAPGVYVDDAKVAALGLRVRDGFTYHGLALNVSMDLTPFERIDPCGYPGLRVTQLADLGLDWTVEDAGRRVAERLADGLGLALSWRLGGA